MNAVLLVPIVVGFLATLLVLPVWIRKAKFMNLIGRDMNKYEKPAVAEAGGIPVIAGFAFGLLFYVSLKIFYFNISTNLTEIFAMLASVLMLAFIGMIDSLLAASSACKTGPDNSGWRMGLRKRYRLLLCLFASVPLMVINAGYCMVSLPFLGNINLGWIYPLILIPVGIIGTSTTFNFLAGYNGLEAGQGIIILSSLSLLAAFTGNSWLAVSGLCMAASLAAFWIFNFYPAAVFPSDVMTYPVGGMIAIMAILGNFEKIAVFFFIPYIAEVFLKARGKLTKQSFANPNKDNTLEMPYKKIYGLEHLAIFLFKKMGKKATEKRVVYLIYAFQIAVILIGLLIFRKNIF